MTGGGPPITGGPRDGPPYAGGGGLSKKKRLRLESQIWLLMKVMLKQTYPWAPIGGAPIEGGPLFP